jgi:hypothetical protein
VERIWRQYEADESPAECLSDGAYCFSDLVFVLRVEKRGPATGDGLPLDRA